MTDLLTGKKTMLTSTVKKLTAMIIFDLRLKCALWYLS